MSSKLSNCGKLIWKHKWFLLMELSILFILWLDKKVLFQQMFYLQKMANCLAFASLIMTAVIYFGHYVKELSLHKIYLVIGFLMGLCYMFMIPIHYTPDESVHYFKAYQMSNVLLGVKDPNHKQISMRYDDAIFPYKGTYDDMGEYDVYYTSVFTDLHVDDEHIVMTKEEPYVTQSYPYFLSALAITLGRLLHISTVWTFFMGRFVNLLFFVAFYAYAIKKMPVAKLGLFGMGLLAIVSQQSFSFAQDYMIMSLSMVILALTLHFWYDLPSGWKKSEWAMLVFASACIFPLKNYSYFLLAILPLILVFKYWKKDKKAAGKFLLVVGLSFLIMIAWKVYESLVGVQTSVTGSVMGEHIITWANVKGWDIPTLLHETFASSRRLLFLIVARTFMIFGGTYWVQAMGEGLGWVNVTVPPFMIYVWFFLFAIMFLRRKQQKIVFNVKIRIFWALLFLLVAAIVVAGLLLGWTPQIYEYVIGVQGRYFLPVIPCLMFALQTGALTLDEKYDKQIAVFAVWHACMTLLLTLSYFNIPTNLFD